MDCVGRHQLDIILPAHNISEPSQSKKFDRLKIFHRRLTVYLHDADVVASRWEYTRSPKNWHEEEIRFIY